MKTTLLTPLAFALMLMFGLPRSEMLPLEVNVAMSAPVSALTTVNDVTAGTEAGAGSLVMVSVSVATGPARPLPLESENGVALMMWVPTAGDQLL